MHIKPEIRLIGIDDSPLINKDILVVGVVMRGGDWIEGVVRTYVEKDGLDSTEKLAEMVNRTRHSGQIRAIMLNGITFAGFNVVDINLLFRSTGIPVIVVMRELPDMAGIREALNNVTEPEKRFGIIKNAGEIKEITTSERGNPIYFQCSGIEHEDAIKMIKLSSIRSRIPEPVRVAHIIATGIVLGESKYRV